MILVAVGTQFPFDRLVKTVDQWAGENGYRDVVAQVGRTAFVPQNLESHPFFSPREFQGLLEQTDLIVAHCGMGSILSALSLGKPIIVMPRSAEKGEHRNDHQFATAKRFSDVQGITVARDEAELRQALDRWGNGNGGTESLPPISTKAPRELTDRLREFLFNCE